MNSLITTYWRHDLDVARLFTGLYYNYFSFRRFPAQLYAGIDLNAYYIYDINFEQEIEYKELTDLNRIYSVETKDPALRFGSSIRTGLKSKFKGYLNLDISFAYTFMNLLGTDDSRGELLTPEKEFETGESTVQELHVNILLRFFL